MAQNVLINGVTYSGVPSVNIPTTDGGTAVFLDTNDADATAANISSGKTAYVKGTKITGSMSVPTISQNQSTKVLSIT